MYKWRNDAKIEEADISWQSIAINIKNILNNNYRAKKFINLNIIDQDEASILKKRQLAKLNNIKNQNDIYSGQKILLRNKKDLYFIGDDNFIAITKYNISHFYAMAVYYLSEELKI